MSWLLKMFFYFMWQSLLGQEVVRWIVTGAIGILTGLVNCSFVSNLWIICDDFILPLWSNQSPGLISYFMTVCRGYCCFVVNMWLKSRLSKLQILEIIIYQTHYEKSDWLRAFNQFTIACELDIINAIPAADIEFIMSNSTSAWLLSPLECSPQKLSEDELCEKCLINNYWS